MSHRSSPASLPSAEPAVPRDTGAPEDPAVPKRIGEVAEMCQVSIRTLRYYEELGLLHPETTKGGIRLYAPSDIERVRKIIRLKELLNFTLDEVQEVVELDDQLDSLRERAEFERHVGHNWEHLLTLNEGYLALLGRQLEFVMAKRRRLDEMVAELEDKIARCRRRRQEFTAKARRQRR